MEHLKHSTVALMKYQLGSADRDQYLNNIEKYDRLISLPNFDKANKILNVNNCIYNFERKLILYDNSDSNSNKFIGVLKSYKVEVTTVL